MFDLTEKVALISGASRGIGAAIAQTLAEFGAEVVLTSRIKENLSGRISTTIGWLIFAMLPRSGLPASLRYRIRTFQRPLPRSSELQNAVR